MTPITAQCLLAAAAKFSLPAAVLWGLLAMEGGQVGAETPNRDDRGRVISHDLGPFQINDRVWLKSMRRYFDQPSPEATRTLLRDNGCANTIGAAAIVSTYVQEDGGDIGLALGHYHSHIPARAEAYRLKLAGKLFAFASISKTQAAGHESDRLSTLSRSSASPPAPLGQIISGLPPSQVFAAFP